MSNDLNDLKLTVVLAEKFNTLDSDGIEKEWKDIEAKGDEATQEMVEDILKRTPGFSMIEMVNFGEYCRKGFTDYEWDDATIEEHFINWLQKIK
jgi:hypothetical protein